MNQKEVSEIRRRFNAERSCISKIYGCYVNSQREIISKIENSVALMPQNDKDKFMSVLKKTLSGTLGKNLIDITFSTQQVTSGEEHALLMKLLKSSLNDEASRDELFEKIIQSVHMDGENYLILLAADTYDVPVKGKDGISELDSETVFSYIICCVCPVKDGKALLGYMADEKDFRSYVTPHIVCPPEVGFMFPAFDDRCANIYNALLYSHNTSVLQSDLISSVFNTETPMSPTEQKETFSNVLTETLENDCSFELIQSVHEQIREKIEQHKESKDPEPLDFDANDVGNILRYSGVSDEKIDAFQKKCDTDFGENVALNPSNIIESKKFEVVTPQVKITVDPEYTCLIRTKIIEGRKYLLIPADDAVAVNGVNVKIPQE